MVLPPSRFLPSLKSIKINKTKKKKIASIKRQKLNYVAKCISSTILIFKRL